MLQLPIYSRDLGDADVDGRGDAAVPVDVLVLSPLDVLVDVLVIHCSSTSVSL